MRIGGFQKLTLLDYPGEVACIIFTAGCNFRCPYCHNSGLIKDKGGISEEEIMGYLKKRSGILDGVVVTGGEPLMHKDIAELITKIRSMGYKIKIDTNGSFPERLRSLVSKGLADYVAMDIKHVPELYRKAAGREVAAEVIDESVKILKASGIRCEFRTTTVKGIHTEEDIEAIAMYLDTDIPYYLQQYKDSGMILAPEGLGNFSEEELDRMADRARKYCPNTSVRG